MRICNHFIKVFICREKMLKNVKKFKKLMFQIWKQNSFALPSNRQLLKRWRHQLPVHVYSSLWLHCLRQGTILLVRQYLSNPWKFNKNKQAKAKMIGGYLSNVVACKLLPVEHHQGMIWNGMEGKFSIFQPGIFLLFSFHTKNLLFHIQLSTKISFHIPFHTSIPRWV